MELVGSVPAWRFAARWVRIICAAQFGSGPVCRTRPSDLARPCRKTRLYGATTPQTTAQEHKVVGAYAWAGKPWRVLTWLIFLAIGLWTLPGLAWHNWGSLYLARAQYSPTTTDLDTAHAAFGRAVHFPVSRQRAWVGQALLASQQAQRDRAMQAWQASDLPAATIMEYGDLLLTTHGAEAASTAYRAAAARFTGSPNPGSYAAARLCQRQWMELVVRDDPYAASCREALAAQPPNLLLNPDFADGVELGWDGNFFFANPAEATLQGAAEEGMPAPAARMDGLTPARHQGLYQVICLAPGSEVIFRGWFKAALQPEAAARLLYIGWQQDGRPQGNEAERMTGESPWVYLERRFAVPATAEPSITFSPVILDGAGTVWMDQFQLEVVTQGTVPAALPGETGARVACRV